MSDTPAQSRIIGKAIAICAGIGAAGMVLFAIAINEQTAFGSSILWSPLYALMGAVGGAMVGVVVGLVAYVIAKVKPGS